MAYEMNDCDVCINPERVFFAMKQGALAWDYAEIEIAELNGIWDFGYSYGGGGGPCMPKLGKWSSREECIIAGYEHLRDTLKRSIGSYGSISKNHEYHLSELEEWWISRNQLTLF